MILDELNKAIESGTPLRVRYFGGSSPGSERELQPLSVKDGKVRAVCALSGSTKTFDVEKMELVVDGVASARAEPVPVPVSVYATVDEFAASYNASFQQQGWGIRHEGQSLSLHRVFKNGKVIQNPDVALTFEDVAHDLVFDGEQIVEANHRARSRPWILRTKNQTTKTFGDLAKAQVAFLESAKALAPNATKPAA